MYEKKTFMFPDTAVSSRIGKGGKGVFSMYVRFDMLPFSGGIRTE